MGYTDAFKFVLKVRFKACHKMLNGVFLAGEVPPDVNFCFNVLYFFKCPQENVFHF